MKPKIDELTYEYPTDKKPVVVGEKKHGCRCEGSCPACILGEVEEHECNRCKRTFCSRCYGIESGPPSRNVGRCSCPEE